MRAVALARADRAFYTTMAIIAAAIAFVGFARSFFLSAFSDSRHLAPIFHIHGAVFTLWLLFYINQNLLIQRGKRERHKRLGRIGAGLALLLVLLGFAVTVYAGKRGFAGPLAQLPDRLQAMVIPFFDMVVFATLMIAALALRGRPEAHKRLMLLATVGGLLGAPISRAPYFVGNPTAQLVLYLALILAGPLYDLITRRRIHVAYLLGLIPLLVLLSDTRLRIGASEPWHRFAGWLTQ